MKALSYDQLRERLATYDTLQPESKQQRIEHFARDESVTTRSLIQLACEAEENHTSNTALLVLQNRANEEVFSQARELLHHVQSQRRSLGAQILREFPRLDLAPHHFSPRIIKQLSIVARKESDISTLTWILSAIGWHKLAQSVSILAEFKAHPAAQVREVVASSMLLCMHSFPENESIFDVLLELARDEDPDVVGCILYDVAEYPELFQTDWSSWALIAETWQTYPGRLGEDACSILARPM